MAKWRKAVSWMAVAIMTVAALSGCYLLPQEEEVLEPPLLTPVEVEYQTVTVELGTIESVITAQGMIVPAKRFDLYYTYEGGRVASFPAEYGAQVKEGDVLIELETEDLKFEMEKMEIQYERQKAAYDKAMKSGSSTTRRNAQWDWDLFMLDYNRIQEQLERATITSPIDGQVIYLAAVDVGDEVTTYSTLVTVADVSKLYVGVTGDSAMDFTTGMEVEVNYNKETYTGVVVQTPRDTPDKINSASAETTTFIEIQNMPEGIFKLGNEVTVRLVEARRENTIVLSRNLVSSYNGRNYVKVLEDGLKVERDVEIGMSNSTQYEILSGLEVGDLVIK